MTGGGSTVANGNTTLTNPATSTGPLWPILWSRTFDNYGTCTSMLPYGPLAMVYGATWNNQAGSVMDFQDNSGVQWGNTGAMPTFNNAGTLGEAGPSTDVSEAGWNDAIAINLTCSFLGAKHQIAEMLKHGGGSVIFTSTFVGYSFAFPGVAAYAASKSGLIGLTQALAAEFGPRGVRVNAILPGAVETGMYREMNDTADKQAFMTNLHALKRVARPEELARSVLYLASDDSAFVTGTASLVDGGASITRS